jgi:hypothetical protein
VKKRETFDAFCRACLDVLKAGRTRHLIVGGVAVTAVGEPRFTADLAVIVFVQIAQLERLLARAIEKGFEADPAVELAAAREGGSVRLTRGRFHFDLIVRSLFIEDLAYDHSRVLKVFARSARFPSPEDLVVLKVVAGRPKDLLDVDGVLKRHREKLDRNYVETTLRRVCDLAEDHAILERWRGCIAKLEA